MHGIIDSAGCCHALNESAPVDMTVASQKGFTLIEITVALVILGILVTGFIPLYNSRVADANLIAAMTEAQDIANIAEKVRSRAISTSVDANGIYSHTYGTLAADSSTSALLTLSGNSGEYKDNSPFGTPYRVNITADNATVTVNIPLDVTPTGVVSTSVGIDSTDLTLYGKQRSTVVRSVNSKSKLLKKQFYQEAYR